MSKTKTGAKLFKLRRCEETSRIHTIFSRGFVYWLKKVHKIRNSEITDVKSKFCRSSLLRNRKNINKEYHIYLPNWRFRA